MSFWLNVFYDYYIRFADAACVAVMFASLLCGLLVGIYVRHRSTAIGTGVTAVVLFLVCGIGYAYQPASPFLFLLTAASEGLAIFVTPLCLGITVGHVMSRLSGVMMNGMAPVNK